MVKLSTSAIASVPLIMLLPITLAPIVGQAASAQGVTDFLSGSKKGTGAAAATDPLKRTTPRSSIYSFLEACHRNDLTLASEYLDLRKIRSDQRATQGPELARELCRVLDRDPQFEVGQLSDASQGNIDDSLSADLDNLDSFRVNGQTIGLQMQRESRQGVNVWLVSGDSVAHTPELNALAGESAFEKKLPRALVTTKLIGTPVWVWLALVLLALILSVVSRLLSRIFLALVEPITKRFAKSLQAYRLAAFTEPLRLLLSVVVFRICMETVAPSALLRDYLIRLLTFLFILGAASFVMRIVDVASDRVISRLDLRQRSLSYSVIPLFVRVVKIFVFCIAILFMLSQWGYSTSTILAGLGVGGIAVALAAQKTIENFFGSISVITDRPVLVGDFCQFGGQVGTVEDIGLRSTRIRTPDRTVVTIPNSVFSTMTLENYSRRDRMWFHPTLRLRRNTTPEQIREMMEAVTKILNNHPAVDASGVPLRFTKIANESFDLDIFSYVLTADYNEYLKVQSELLLAIMEAASRLNVGFAVPFQESVSLSPELLKTPASEPFGSGAQERSG